MKAIKTFSIVLENATGYVVQYLGINKDKEVVLLQLGSSRVVRLTEPLDLFLERKEKGYISIFEPREDNRDIDETEEWSPDKYNYRDAILGIEQPTYETKNAI